MAGRWCACVGGAAGAGVAREVSARDDICGNPNERGALGLRAGTASAKALGLVRPEKPPRNWCTAGESLGVTVKQEVGPVTSVGLVPGIHPSCSMAFLSPSRSLPIGKMSLLRPLEIPP